MESEGGFLMRGIDTASTVETATMRAAVIRSPGDAGVVERPVPEPGVDEVRVRLEGSGVCASNLALWQGQPWFEYPIEAGAPGHEGWGVVDAVGEGVSAISEGQRVALLSGRAYAEYDVARADQVVPLPAALDGAPFPGEPLGCAFNILRRSGIERGETVAVVGAGFLGILLTRLAVDVGAHVIALSRRSFALDLATEYGAAEVVRIDDRARAVDQIRASTGGAFCDRVIECTGKQEPLDLSAQITRERGVLVIAGYHQDGARQVDMQLWNWRGLDVVNAHERDPAIYLQGMREAVEAVSAGVLDPAPLYTHTFPLDELDRALDHTRDRPDGFLKALVVT